MTKCEGKKEVARKKTRIPTRKPGKTQENKTKITVEAWGGVKMHECVRVKKQESS